MNNINAIDKPRSSKDTLGIPTQELDKNYSPITHKIISCLIKFSDEHQSNMHGKDYDEGETLTKKSCLRMNTTPDKRSIHDSLLIDNQDLDKYKSYLENQRLTYNEVLKSQSIPNSEGIEQCSEFDDSLDKQHLMPEGVYKRPFVSKPDAKHKKIFKSKKMLSNESSLSNKISNTEQSLRIDDSITNRSFNDGRWQKPKEQYTESIIVEKDFEYNGIPNMEKSYKCLKETCMKKPKFIEKIDDIQELLDPIPNKILTEEAKSNDKNLVLNKIYKTHIKDIEDNKQLIDDDDMLVNKEYIYEISDNKKMTCIDTKNNSLQFTRKKSSSIQSSDSKSNDIEFTEDNNSDIHFTDGEDDNIPCIDKIYKKSDELLINDQCSINKKYIEEKDCPFDDSIESSYSQKFSINNKQMTHPSSIEGTCIPLLHNPIHEEESKSDIFSPLKNNIEPEFILSTSHNEVVPYKGVSKVHLKGLFVLSKFAKLLKISEYIMNPSKDLLKKTVENKLIYGHNLKQMVVAIIYYSARSSYMPFSFKEVILMTNTVKRSVRRCVKILNKSFGYNYVGLSDALLKRPFEKLKADEEMKETSLSIFNRMKNHRVLGGKNPYVLVGVALLLASNHLGKNYTIKTIAEKASISVYTLKMTMKKNLYICIGLLQKQSKGFPLDKYD